MTTDLQGVALIITAVGSSVGTICASIAAVWSVKSHATIEKVGTQINGRMSQFLQAKDSLTEIRVAGSFKDGEKAGEARRRWWHFRG
jgi:hypothetical protein